MGGWDMTIRAKCPYCGRYMLVIKNDGVSCHGWSLTGRSFDANRGCGALVSTTEGGEILPLTQEHREKMALPKYRPIIENVLAEVRAAFWG